MTLSQRNNKKSKNKKKHGPPARAILILLGTSTVEKVADYEAIARAQGLPLFFLSLREVADAVPQAVEDKGDRVLNALQKHEKTAGTIDLCRQPNSGIRRALKAKCVQLGIAFDESAIGFAVEDSTIGVPHDIWKGQRPKLAPHVPEYLLASADKNGTESGPGAETGPILAAAGINRFFNYMREAAFEAGYGGRDVPIRQHVTLALTMLNDPQGAPAKIFDCDTTTLLFAPDGLHRPLRNSHASFLHASQFQCAPDRKDASIQSINGDYMVGKSERAKMVQMLAAHFSLSPDAYYGFADAAKAVACKQGRSDKKRKCEVVIVMESRSRKMGCFRIKSRHYPPAGSDYERINLWPVWSNADAVIFPPFDPRDAKARILAFTRLTAAICDKQIEARSMHMPIIVLDDGCWKPYLDANFAMANFGMVKDFPRTPLHEGRARIVTVKGVSHTATSYVDILCGPERKLLDRAARQVLEHRLATYHPFISPGVLGTDFLTGGTPKPEGLYAAGVFVSALSDNRELIEDAQRLGRTLARNGDGLVWGAGDRHGMGAVYEGYRRNVGRWCAGFSTSSLVISETENGRMPESHYWQLSPDIARRITGMFEGGDIFITMPGGIGTVEEALTYEYLRINNSALVANKPCIYYSPDLHRKSDYHDKPYWEPALRAWLGEDATARLMADHDSYACRDLYLATHPEELLERYYDLRAAWMAVARTSRRPISRAAAAAGLPALP